MSDETNRVELWTAEDIEWRRRNRCDLRWLATVDARDAEIGRLRKALRMTREVLLYANEYVRDRALSVEDDIATALASADSALASPPAPKPEGEK